jgi:hypothetical protein
MLLAYFASHRPELAVIFLGFGLSFFIRTKWSMICNFREFTRFREFKHEWVMLCMSSVKRWHLHIARIVYPLFPLCLTSYHMILPCTLRLYITNICIHDPRAPCRKDCSSEIWRVPVHYREEAQVVCPWYAPAAAFSFFLSPRFLPTDLQVFATERRVPNSRWRSRVATVCVHSCRASNHSVLAGRQHRPPAAAVLLHRRKRTVTPGC